MPKDFKPVVVSTSCDDQAVCRDIAQLVLEKRLAACVQLMSPMTSFYWWEGRMARDSEYLLVMKSERSLFGQLVKTVRSIHPYDVPEIIATDITDIDADYAGWMQETLGHG